MPTGPNVTLIVGDGRTRAAAQFGDPDGSSFLAGGLSDFRGMTVAEALRLNGLATRTPTMPGFGLAIEDRGGSISLLDIADAFEELTVQSEACENGYSDLTAHAALSELRVQLIQFISDGRIY